MWCRSVRETRRWSQRGRRLHDGSPDSVIPELFPSEALTALVIFNEYVCSRFRFGKLMLPVMIVGLDAMRR